MQKDQNFHSIISVLGYFNNITNRSKIVGKRLNKSFFVIIFNDFINNILSQVHIMSILCRNWDVSVTVEAFYYVVKFMEDCHGQ